jgi:hypothetical protein
MKMLKIFFSAFLLLSGADALSVCKETNISTASVNDGSYVTVTIQLTEECTGIALNNNSDVTINDMRFLMDECQRTFPAGSLGFACTLVMNMATFAVLVSYVVTISLC